MQFILRTKKSLMILTIFLTTLAPLALKQKRKENNAKFLQNILIINIKVISCRLIDEHIFNRKVRLRDLISELLGHMAY